jgi:hypothetical protein
VSSKSRSFSLGGHTQTLAKEVFFPAAWAEYADAKPSTLRIVPPDARLPKLEQDYRKMQEMIFGEPPAFERLLEVLREIERAINIPDGG